MVLHSETFDYLRPANDQMFDMSHARKMAKDYAEFLERLLPDGPDKTYALRKFREVAMWVNISITREADGSPRKSKEVDVKDYPSDHPVKGDLGSIPL